MGAEKLHVSFTYCDALQKIVKSGSPIITIRGWMLKNNEAEFYVKILIVDDDDEDRFWNEKELRDVLGDLGRTDVKFASVGTVEEMLSCLKDMTYHMVLLDKDLGKDAADIPIDGTDYIEEIKDLQPNTRVVMLTSYRSYKYAAEAIRKGAKAFVTKGVDEEDIIYRKETILSAVREALHEIDLLKKQYLLKNREGGQVVYQSQAMKDLEWKMETLAAVNTPVLFIGESGLGKTHAAERLSYLSKIKAGQKSRTFVDVNINEIPTGLLEARLFGSEKGSYTSSLNRSQGYFELASDGDLFLDEIGDASMELQGKLLKVIEKRAFRRVGGQTELKTNARVIFATNKNLEEMVANGTFRQDLYARICAVTIQIPTLKERLEDLPFICESLCQKISTPGRKISFQDFPQNLKDHFQAGEFPLNIRGIRNDLERLFIFLPPLKDGTPSYRGWKHHIGREGSVPKNSKATALEVDSSIDCLVSEVIEGGGFSLTDLKEKIEKAALEKLTGMRNVDRARALGISEANTSAKMRKYFGTSKQRKKGLVNV